MGAPSAPPQSLAPNPQSVTTITTTTITSSTATTSVSQDASPISLSATTDTNSPTGTGVVALATGPTDSLNQNSTRTIHRGAVEDSSTTTASNTEETPNAFVSSNSPSEVVVIVATTVTQSPMTSMTTMTTQVVTQTSIVTRHNEKTGIVIAGSVAGAISFACLLIAAIVAIRRYLKRRREATADDASSFMAPLRERVGSWLTYTDKFSDDLRSASYYPSPTTGVSGFDYQGEFGSGSGSGRYSNFDVRTSVGSGQGSWPERLEPNRRRESVILGDDSESLAGIPDPPPAYIP